LDVANIIASLCGFLGSLALTIPAWRSRKVRKTLEDAQFTQLTLGEMPSLADAQKKVLRDSAKLLRQERLWYPIGCLLLLVSFSVFFVMSFFGQT